MIFLEYDSGSGKNFLIRPDPDPLLSAIESYFFLGWVLTHSRFILGPD